MLQQLVGRTHWTNVLSLTLQALHPSEPECPSKSPGTGEKGLQVGIATPNKKQLYSYYSKPPSGIAPVKLVV
jgi:hypothetical protein